VHSVVQKIFGKIQQKISNKKLSIKESAAQWVPFIRGERKELKIAMDGMEF
jgi:hypothetical protein